MDGLQTLRPHGRGKDRAVAAPQRVGLHALTEEEEDTAMIRAIREGEAREKDDEFLKHEEMMQKLLGRDES